MTLAEAIEAVVARIMRRVDHHALYPARVVEQRADGSLDVVPDSPRVPPCQRVPVRTLRGLSVEVEPGARVLLGYEGGDPAAPVALLWEPGDATVVRVNGGDSRVAREGDATGNGTLTIAAASTGVPPVTTLTITYAPPSGPPQVVIVSGLVGAGVAVGGPILLSGEITEGSDVVRIP